METEFYYISPHSRDLFPRNGYFMNFVLSPNTQIFFINLYSVDDLVFHFTEKIEANKQQLSWVPNVISMIFSLFPNFLSPFSQSNAASVLDWVLFPSPLQELFSLLRLYLFLWFVLDLHFIQSYHSV